MSGSDTVIPWALLSGWMFQPGDHHYTLSWLAQAHAGSYSEAPLDWEALQDNLQLEAENGRTAR